MREIIAVELLNSLYKLTGLVAKDIKLCELTGCSINSNSEFYIGFDEDQQEYLFWEQESDEE